MSISFYVIAVIVCVMLSAFFSASEMAFSSANRIRLGREAESGSKKSALAVRVLDHFDMTLSTILVGNNLVNVTSSALASIIVMLLLGKEYAWLSTLVITVIVIIFGETIPKIIAQKNATRLAASFSYPIFGLDRILKPLTWLVVSLVDLLTGKLKGEERSDAELAVDELHTIIDTAEDEAVLDEDASELVSAAIDFGDIPVSDVMTARVDMLAIDIEDDWDRIKETIRNSPFSRLPVYRGSADDIIGILPINRFLRSMIDDSEPDLMQLLTKPNYVYKTMKLPAVLYQLRSSRQHLAIVTDEYSGTLGVVSLEDVLEELVGEIWDETDTVEEEIVEQQKGLYELDGDTPVSELIDLMDWDEDAFDSDFDSETVGGWCMEMRDGFPHPGYTFDYLDARVKVEAMDERRVRKVRVERIEPEDKEEGE